MIAQEVLPLVKEAVKTHDHKIVDESTLEYVEVEMERMGMKYQQLIPVLIKATQEQQAIIEDLEKTAATQGQINQELIKKSEAQEDLIEKLNDRLMQLERAYPVEASNEKSH